MAETIIQLRDKNNDFFVDLSIPAPPADNCFYVAFHGLVSLVDGPGDKFHAYALNIGGDHQYRLGNWLLETDVPRGFSAELRGVNGSPRYYNAHRLIYAALPPIEADAARSSSNFSCR